MTLKQAASSCAALLRRAARLAFGRRPWKIAGLWLKGLRMLAVDLAGIAGVVVLVAFVWREATRETVHIDPIGVPPSLAEDGFTGEVLAQRLMDQIIEIQAKASTTMPKRKIGVAFLQTDFVVPGVGFSVGTAAGFVGEMLGTRRTRVRGEFTRQDDLYVLTLRVDGREAIARTDPVARKDLDKALKSGAEKIVRVSEPYVLASYYYDVDKTLALAEADEIIKNGGDDVESVVRSYNLRGLIFADRKQVEEAIGNYRTAIEIDPEFSLSYGNLAAAFEDSKRIDEALAVYRTLVTIEQSPAAYNNLARLLVEKNEVDEAIEYYRKAIALDQSIAILHSNLGEAFRRRKELDDAMTSLLTAIKRDAKYAPAYFNLALVYRDKNEIEQAIAYLHQSIAADPKLAVVHYELGLMLDRLALARESENDWTSAEAAARDACDAVKRAIELEPGNATFAEALKNLGNGKGCDAS
jgi:tetratricopeptide (TPR) repeat protein